MARKILSWRTLPPGVCGVILVLVLALSILATLRLKVNNAPEAYLPKTAPSVVLDKELRKKFPGDQVLIALFQGDVYSDHFLSGLLSATRRLQKQPLVQRVLSVFTVDHVGGTEDGFTVDPLLDPKKFKSLSIDARRLQVLNDRFAPGLLASSDGTALALVIRPVRLDQSWQRMALASALRKSINAAGISGYLVAMGGQVAVYTAEFRSMIRDTLTFVPIVFLLGVVLLWLMFRRLIAVVAGSLAMAVVTAATVAIIAISGYPYTLVTAMLPSLMTALTAALLIHFFNAITLAAERGLTGAERVAWACRNIERPARFTALTTAAGLASLALSSIPPIRVFGLAAAAGTLLIYLVCIVLLPPLFVRWDKHAWPKEGTGLAWAIRLVRFLSTLGIRRAGIVVIVTILVLLLTIPLIRRVTVETDLLKFFSPDRPITLATHLIKQKLSGVTTLEVVFDGPDRDALKDPQRLQELVAIENKLRALPQVDRTLSMMDVIEEMNWAFHGEDAKFRRIPQNRNLISQYLLIYDGRDLYDLVDREFQQTRLVLTLNVNGAGDISTVIHRIRHILQIAHPHGLKWHIGGFGRLFSDQDELLIKGQIRSMWGAFILIFGLLITVWRSVPASMLTIIPNIAPVLVMFATMGALGIWLDMATAMIASVVVGIAVDDTIHLYYIYRTRRRAGAGPVMALGRAYHDAGRAVVITTVILCAQFLILTISQFRPTVEFGFLTALGLAAALLFDLLLLPAMLILINRSWRRVG